MDRVINYYELILHDLGNLQSQVLYRFCIDEKQMAIEIEDRMNFLFGMSGKKDQFNAEIIVHFVDEVF
jgi:hypothetical protein